MEEELDQHNFSCYVQGMFFYYYRDKLLKYNYFIYSRNNQNVENMVDNKHLEEALHLIIKHCSSLEIESQVKNSSVSYKRLYQNGMWRNVECVGTRSTSGTTVSVFDFFRPPSSEETFDFDYQSLEKLIASFFLLHSHISFSLRVDPSKPPSLQTKKAKNTMLAAQQLFKSESIIPFRGSSRHFKVKGLFINHPGESSSWFIFVNSQLVESKEIVDLITSVLSNLTSSEEQRFAIILNIKVRRNFSLILLPTNRSYLFADLIIKILSNVCKFFLVFPNCMQIYR
jgi:hypothetical protein